MELYNADTGALLCQHYPTYGESHDTFDELGYLALPPCMWGTKEVQGTCCTDTTSCLPTLPRRA